MEPFGLVPADVVDGDRVVAPFPFDFPTTTTNGAISLGRAFAFSSVSQWDGVHLLPPAPQRDLASHLLPPHHRTDASFSDN